MKHADSSQHDACASRGCRLDEANVIIRRLADITYNGQANPHILLIEQADKIKELEAEVEKWKGIAWSNE
jgi:hypothetical protein